MKNLLVTCCLYICISYQAVAQNVYSRDGNACDLSSRTRLSELCLNGMGMPSGGTQADLIAQNPNIAGMIVQAAQEYGVEPNLALAVSGHEGRMSACAGSDTGVQGPMQLTVRTGQGYGMDRGVLSDNIRGGMMTLRDAVRRCGGSTDVSCLASVYNGSSRPGEQAGWTRGVQQRYAQMQNGSAVAPAGCNNQSASCGPGDFPDTRTTAIASAPPPPAATDILVNDGQV